MMESQPIRMPGARAVVRVRVAARTDVGLVRERNEDHFLVADLNSGAGDVRRLDRVGAAGLLLGVCDGMGGAAAGDVASQIAATQIPASMQRVPVHADDREFARALVEAVLAAGERIREDGRSHGERRGMGTTATVAAVRKDRLFLGQVGDSRAYLWRRGELTQISRDQSLMSELLAIGSLKPEEMESFARPNVILQALGTTEDVWVDLSSLALRRGDRLLLCSDGLTGPVHDMALRGVLAEHEDLEACAERLIELAKGGGGRDNITVVLCEFGGEGLAPARAEERPDYQPYEVVEQRRARKAFLKRVRPDTLRQRWQIVRREATQEERGAERVLEVSSLAAGEPESPGRHEQDRVPAPHEAALIPGLQPRRGVAKRLGVGLVLLLSGLLWWRLFGDQEQGVARVKPAGEARASASQGRAQRREPGELAHVEPRVVSAGAVHPQGPEPAVEVTGSTEKQRELAPEDASGAATRAEISNVTSKPAPSSPAAGAFVSSASREPAHAPRPPLAGDGSAREQGSETKPKRDLGDPSKWRAPAGRLTQPF